MAAAHAAGSIGIGGSATGGEAGGRACALACTMRGCVLQKWRLDKSGPPDCFICAIYIGLDCFVCAIQDSKLLGPRALHATRSIGIGGSATGGEAGARACALAC